LRMQCSAKRWASQETLARNGLSVKFFHMLLTGWKVLPTMPVSDFRCWCSRRSSQHMRRLPVARRGPSTKSPVSSCEASSRAARSVHCHIMVSSRKMRMNSSMAAEAPSSIAIAVTSPPSSSIIRSCKAHVVSAGLLAAVKGSRCSSRSTRRREESERM